MARITSRPTTVSVIPPMQVSALDVTAEDPTNPQALYGVAGIGPLREIKHHALLENTLPGYVTPPDANKKLFLFGGDWTDAWPGPNTPGFPPATWQSYVDGRQEMWFAELSSAALAGGTLRFKLAQNFYSNYPWSGSGGYFGPGRPGGGATPQKGPYAPDALGFVMDRRGEFWMGPCNVGYSPINVDSEMAGETFQYWAPVYKWNMPGLHPVTGVRLGNGWTRPNQNRLKSPGAQGLAGTDFDVGLTTDSETLGVGRPSRTAYDPVTDALCVMGVQSSATELYFALYRFPCTPTAGVHTWTRTVLPSLPLAQVGLSNATGGFVDSTERKNGLISNQVVCNGKLYFTLIGDFPVASGGNVAANRSHLSWLFCVDLANPTAAAPRWVPYPAQQSWWLRLWDGPQGALAHSLGKAPGTPAQYRSLTAVDRYIVAGPDRWTKVDQDPFIWAYDTVLGTYRLWPAPQSVALTNGGHDWPNGIFTLAAVPSLGEVWLGGCGTENDLPDSQPLLTSYNLHDWSRAKIGGQWAGRRIIRFKVA